MPTYPSVVAQTFGNSQLVWQPLTSKIPNAKWASTGQILFTTASTWTIDLGTANSLAQLGNQPVQAMYVDASKCLVGPIYIQCGNSGTGQMLKIKAGTCGYYPVLSSTSQFTVSNYSAWLNSYFGQNTSNPDSGSMILNQYNAAVSICFMNVPFVQSVWQVGEPQCLSFNQTTQITAAQSLPYNVSLINLPIATTVKAAQILIDPYSNGSSASVLDVSLTSGQLFNTQGFIFLKGQWVLPATAGGIKGDSLPIASLQSPVALTTQLNNSNVWRTYINMNIVEANVVATFNAYIYTTLVLSIDDIYTQPIAVGLT